MKIKKNEIKGDNSYKLDEALNVKNKLFAFTTPQERLSDLGGWRDHFELKGVPYIITQNKDGFTLWKERRVRD